MKQRSLVATMTSLVLMGSMAGAMAADAPLLKKTPPQSHPEKSCTDLSAEAKVECERVAKQMKESAKNPTGPSDSSTEGVGMHSSPVMTDQKELAVEKANKQGKDPRKAVEKLEKKDNPSANPSTNPPPKQ
jgi:hypothetical protein